MFDRNLVGFTLAGQRICTCVEVSVLMLLFHFLGLEKIW